MSAAMLPATIPSVPINGVPLLTADEFADRYDGQRVELVRGVVEELPVPFQPHARVCTRITSKLDVFVETHGLGIIVSHDSWIRTTRGPDSVLGPDVFFISYERQPKGPVPARYPPRNPELVVEVRSTSDTWSKMLTRTLEYLDSDVLVVVILDPFTTSAMVYRPNALPATFTAEQDLVVPDVLPGFAVNVGSLFA